MSTQNHTGESQPKILIVEDSPTQAEKLRYLLEAHNYQVLAAENGKRALDLLGPELPVLVISDIIMPEMDGYKLCKRIKLGERTKHLPVILLTSLSNSEDVLEGLECGADYFITKPYSENYLLTSIEQILLNRKLHSKDRVRIGTEIWVGGKSRLITTDQQQTLSLLISTYEAAVRTNGELLQAQNELRSLNSRLEDLVAERTAALRQEIKERRQSEERVQHLNRILRAIRNVNELVVREDDPQRLAQGVCRVLVEHRGYGSAFILLADEQGGLQAYTEAGPSEVYQVQPGDPSGGLPACCREAERRVGIYHVTERGQLCTDCPLAVQCGQSDVMCACLKHVERNYGSLAVSMDHPMAMDAENQALFSEMAADVALALHNLEQGKAMQRAEKEKERIEAELLQAQKMEAVGRLAGGMAHDFNNMLGVILGYAEIALARVIPADPLYDDLQEILKAGQRAAELTRQLLAFSSRQVVAPKVIDLNQEIADQQKMLARLIGENLEFKFVPTEDLWSLFIDPSQVGQILANLAVNARDAIADTGTITIETANAVLDENYCRNYAQATPGEYVLLSFSDTGVGMDAELVTHIFEPFFTTKGEGKGTGLGLSTVFGIVKQYDGFIHTYSEPGLGTTFKIYFPRFLGQAEVPIRKAEEKPVWGAETVLVVEDEKQLLDLSKVVLERHGYNVLPAATPSEACQLARDYQGEIHLLLTDVVMPEMNGKELQARILAVRPGIKTVFMSGYTANAIVHRGVIKKGVAFISKPFTINSLTRKVREALDK
ncbi:MAG: response regulator [Desulfarculus sp.]|jgi:signal transduction histidine kinase/response regulator RpfG family c-di-GMP phosphodiesterase|nr:MAG: response regulator [Desulfarculus sp.]